MKNLTNTFVSSARAFVVCLLSAACTASPGPISDHFDGTRFHNAEQGHSFFDEVRWLWEMNTEKWPRWIVDSEQPKPIERAEQGALRVTYINHATMLIQLDGINILTDPIWSFRAGPLPLIGVKRVRAPGIAIEQLPPIDYILLSHDHYDHLDLPTIRRLHEAHQPRFITGLGNGSLLASVGIKDAVVLDWWKYYQPNGARIRFVFVPALHGSGRLPFSTDRSLWGGFVIETPGGQVYFAGDTGYGRFLQDIAARFKRIRLAILPVGNYEKRWFMKRIHMNPDDAVRAFQELRANQAMGMHYATFAEHPEQTIDAHEKDLAAALQKNALDLERFRVMKFGEGRDVPAFRDNPD